MILLLNFSWITALVVFGLLAGLVLYFGGTMYLAEWLDNEFDIPGGYTFFFLLALLISIVTGFVVNIL
jgi:hypothetical protein